MEGNFQAVYSLASTVQSTLGPNSAHKLLFSNDSSTQTTPSSSSLLTTNDGATILKTLKVNVIFFQSFSLFSSFQLFIITK